MHFSRFILLSVLLATHVLAQYVPLQLVVENGKRLVRWNVAAGTVRIMKSTTLAPGSWVPAPTPRQLGGDWWEVEAPTNEARVFYKADPPMTPTLPPQNMGLAMGGLQPVAGHARGADQAPGRAGE